MTTVRFVNLHNHSCFSIRDAHSRVDELVKRAKELNQIAVALTDHGVLHGIPELFRQCAIHDIKPIAGMEGYICEGSREEPSANYHQLLIAKNETGWVNLMQLSSEAYLTGFYNRPRMDLELLREHSEGLIATSSCLSGLVPRAILGGDYKKAESLLKTYVDIFGDDFYIEIQPNRTSEQQMVNRKLIEFAHKLGIKLVATGDVHFVHEDDVTAHQGMLCLARNGRMETDSEPSYPDEEIYYMHSAKGMYTLLREQGVTHEDALSAINNTVEVAEKIDFDLKKKEDLLPEFPLPDGVSKDTHLGTMVKQGLMRKIKQPTKEYIDRIKFELGVIRQKGYQDYFLIKADALKFCKEQGILVGFGRGSGAGSLVAYLMDITEIDPIEHGLIFERFLDITRQKMPDIDSDIQGNRRHELLDYLREKYGHRRVAQVANYGTMPARLAFKNALMVYDIPFGTSQEITGLIPEELGITIEEAYRIAPELVAMRSKKVKRKDGKMVDLDKVYRMAERFEGVVDKLGRHAGGILISPDDIMNHFPVFVVNGDAVVQWNKDDIEDMGGVKFDFLGLKTLETIALALESIEEETGERLDIYEIVRRHDDPKTYQLIAEGRTDNVFQLSSDGMKKLCRAVKPTTLEHITAINALYRPPALASGDTWKYARIKNGEEAETYSHPEEKSITGETYGIITYQEHVMNLVHHFAGWDYGIGDSLRKKKADDLEEMRTQFIDDCEHNFKPSTIEETQLFNSQMDEIWSRIVRYMGYGFNKSHGVSYSVMSYLTAYLEANYQAFWFSAIMTTKMSDLDKVAQVFSEIKSNGFPYQAPDINLSGRAFRPKDGTIVFPLGVIKGVGPTAIEEILRARQEGPFKSIEDLMDRVNKKVVSARPMKPLILAGAFDSLYPELTRQGIMLEYYRVKKQAKKDIEEVELWEWTDEVQADYEKELVGVYLTAHPLTKYHSTPWADYANQHRGALVPVKVQKVNSFLDKNQKRMAFVSTESPDGPRELVVFQVQFKRYEGLLKKGNTLLVKGKKDGDKLLVDTIKELN